MNNDQFQRDAAQAIQRLQNELADLRREVRVNEQDIQPKINNATADIRAVINKVLIRERLLVEIVRETSDLGGVDLAKIEAKVRAEITDDGAWGATQKTALDHLSEVVSEISGNRETE